MLRNHLVEALLQGQELSLDAVQESPVHIQPADRRRDRVVFYSYRPDTDLLRPSAAPGGCGERAPLSLPDVFLLGVLRDWDALAVGLELVLDDLSVRVVLHAESVVQDAGDVIVPEEEGGRV